MALAPADSSTWLEAALGLGSLLAGEHSVREPAAAIAILEPIADRSAAASYFLGEAHALSGDLDAAERAWQRGLAIDPDHRGIKDVLEKLPADRASRLRATADERSGRRR
jgi:predicted TPR repeat methyltransferase